MGQERVKDWKDEMNLNKWMKSEKGGYLCVLK